MMQRVFPTSSDSPLLFVSGAKTAKAIIARLYYIHTYIHTYMKCIMRCIVENGSNQRRGLLLGGGV